MPLTPATSVGSVRAATRRLVDRLRALLRPSAMALTALSARRRRARHRQLCRRHRQMRAVSLPRTPSVSPFQLRTRIQLNGGKTSGAWGFGRSLRAFLVRPSSELRIDAHLVEYVYVGDLRLRDPPVERACVRACVVASVRASRARGCVRACERGCVVACVEGRGSRVEGRGSRVEGRGSRVEGRGSRVEGRGSRVEPAGSANQLRVAVVPARARRRWPPLTAVS
jgi:hypothetical protein